MQVDEQELDLSVAIVTGWEKLEAVGEAIQDLDRDLPTAYALFVLAYETLRARGMGSTAIIELQLKLEKDRKGKGGGN